MGYFTIKRSIFLVPYEKNMKEFEKIDKYAEILEKSGVWKYIKIVKSKIQKCKGRIGYNPYNMFMAVTYCFAYFKGSLRDIEDKCAYDIRVYYIMEGNVPDFSTFCNFINEFILPYHYEIFTTINKQIIKELNLKIEDVYIDGTKFLANANKYKFVWKPTKFHKNLDIKIKQLLKKMEVEYYEKDLIKSYEFNDLIKKYVNNKKINIDTIPSGRGRRLTKEQKNYKLAYTYLLKLLEYEEKERICGENRKSYYKTDKDATAMVLKEDYYSKTGNDFHPAYNIQLMVSNLLILMYGVYQDRTDYYTFVSMNDLYYKYYGEYPKNECGDSGYGIYLNYQYIKNNKIGNYIKFQQWEGEKTGKKPQLFYVFEDGVMCLNSCIGEEIEYDKNRHKKFKNTKLYKFTGCGNCNYSYICKKYLKNKNENYRYYELNLEYEFLKEEARKNLLSPKGIEIRINRSIQVEGTYGQLKQNMCYVRVRRRSISKVLCEIMLMCLGANIKRLFKSFDEKVFTQNCWNKPSNLGPEKFATVKQKKEDVK